MIAQYYNFLRLGRDGYRRVQRCCRDVASELADRVAALGPFQLLTDGRQLPVFAFTIADDNARFSVFDVSAVLGEQGLLVPAYTCPGWNGRSAPSTVRTPRPSHTGPGAPRPERAPRQRARNRDFDTSRHRSTPASDDQGKIAALPTLPP